MTNVALEAQDYLYEILGSKVDDLITTMAFVDYEPKRMATECHVFVDELVDFLRVTFLCLTNLPLTSIEAIHVTCCRRVASGIMKFLTAPITTHGHGYTSTNIDSSSTSTRNSINPNNHGGTVVTTRTSDMTHHDFGVSRINIKALKQFEIDILK